MNDTDIKNLLIPGYSTLNKVQQGVFEASAAGQKFLGIVEDFSQQNNAIPKPKKFLDILFFGHNIDTTELEESIIEQQETLMAAIKTSAAYQVIHEELVRKVLSAFYPEFVFLSQKNQSKLYKASYSQTVIALYGPNGLSSELSYPQQQLWDKWERSYAESQEHPAMIAEIKAEKVANKLAEVTARTHNLAVFFPVLQPENVQELLQKYKDKLNESLDCAPNIELIYLTQLVAEHFDAACAANLAFMGAALTDLNKEEAKKIVENMLYAFKHELQFDLGQQLNAYRKTLGKFTKANLLSINGKTRPLSEKTISQQVDDGLSFIFTNSQLQSANQFVSRLAEAHAFLTNTGFSSQNDNIVNTLLELYNTNRIKEEVNETKEILGKLFTPLKPLYQEFKDIAMNEKNRLAIFFRSIAPIIIIFASIVSISVAMAPLAIPEVLLVFLLIPILFIGLAVGSAYVSAKNWIRQTCRQVYYGGPFEIPEYQVNARMINAFKSEKQAQMVRDFYVQEIQKCEQIEKHFMILDKDGSLTNQDITNRENNTKRFCALHMEWYDIHSNSRLGNNQIPNVVAGRFNADIDAEYQKMESTLMQLDVPTIVKSLDKTLLDLKTTMLVVVADKKSPDTSPFSFSNSYYSPSLFTPQSRNFQKRASQLDKLATDTFAAPVI